MEILHRRGDGSFVIMWRGHPYHVTAEDPLFAEVAAEAEGQEYPPEPPPVDVAPLLPAPTVESLKAELDRIAAQLAALGNA